MAIAALGTLLAGGAATMTVGAIIAGVGTGLSIVGAVTGNKGMMKLGGVMGMVGGIAGLAGAATAGEVAGSTMGSTTEAAGEVALDAGGSQIAGSTLGDGSAMASYSMDGAAPVTDWGQATATNWGAAADDAMKSLNFDTSALTSINPQSAFDSAPKAGAQSIVPEYDIKTDLINAPTTQNAATQTGVEAKSPLADATSSSDGFKATSSSGYFSDFLKWVKNNEKTAEGIMKIGGSALNGMQQQEMFNQKMEFEKSRGAYGNVVADVYGQQPRRPLIGAKA